MRDHNDGMIEITEASQRDEAFFVTISVAKKLGKKTFNFGVTRSAYKAVCRVLQSRLSEVLLCVKRRYFWDGSTSGKAERIISLGIRCETEQGGRKFSMKYRITLPLI